MTRERALALLQIARARLLDLMPWLGPALYWMEYDIVESGLPAVLAVELDGRVVFCLEHLRRLLKRLATDEQVRFLSYLWYHAAAHLVREHGPRGQALAAKEEKWHLACDLEIHDDLPWELTPPEGTPIVTPLDLQLPPGKVAEYYYRRLPRCVGIRLCSGTAVCLHGLPRPGNAERLAELREIQKRVREAIERQRGDVPGGWDRWAAGWHPRGRDWRLLLRRALQPSAQGSLRLRRDYTLVRPHRRTTAYDPIILPALRSPAGVRLAIVVDTSGSISDQDLRQALAEVATIVRRLRMPVTVIPCDARAYGAVRVFSGDLRRLRRRLRGGGGTDMRVGIAYARRLQPRADTVLVLTDGWTPFPRPYSDVRVVWGILHRLGEGARTPPCPPWRPEDIVRIPVGL